MAHPSVREAAAVVRERPDGQHLAAYVTAGDGLAADPQVLRDHLRQQLPAYMVPASITTLPAMPLSHNGKLDRSALPDRSPATTSGGDHPATPTEHAVAAVFSDILGLAEVDVTASFFVLGGNSFDAVRAIRRIEGATVGLLGANPSVRQLVAALEEQAGPQVLLRLSEPDTATHTLVCVPFGGGSAITYQPLSRALSPHLALFAVSPPGHELGGDPELRPLEEVAREAAEAVLKTVEGPISVYGHCAGVGLAVELTRQLEAAGRPAERLFLGGSYPFYEPGGVGRMMVQWSSAMVNLGLMQVSSTTIGTNPTGSPKADRAEMRYLRSIGGFQEDITDEELAFVMRAFRHDVGTAARYFTTNWPARAETTPLAAPITVLAGTADPLTPKPERRYRSWRRFGTGLDLVTVPDGGHYFHQQQPDLVAAAILERIAL
jgi:surfactin synthase thioesterase subunit